MIKALDINSLRVVHLVTINGSVTKTAALLNVTPGAITYLLNKSRIATGSTLFRRTKHGMIANNTAKELSQRYLNITKEVIDYPNLTAMRNRTVTVTTYSLLEFMLAKELSDKTAFPVKLEFSSPEINNDNRLEKLRNREVDIDIGTRLENDRSIIQTRLFSSPLSIFMSKDNPKSNGFFTLNDWLEASHVRWSRRTTFICDDYIHANRFNEIMERKNVSMISSDSLNMAILCAFTDHIMLMPTILSKFLTEHLPIISSPPPKELEMRFECYLHYHKSLSKDKMLNILLQKFQDIIK